MKIAIGADHAAYELKYFLVQYLESKGHSVIDHGPESGNISVDYPDFADKVCRSVTDKDADYGILLCGTGIGMSIAANKHKGIRAALCLFPEMAALSRRHNHANVLVLGGRLIGSELAGWIVDAFLDSSEEGGRHQTRVDKLETDSTRDRVNEP